MQAILSTDEELNRRWLTFSKVGEEAYCAFTEPIELISAMEKQPLGHVVLSDRYFDFSSFCDFTESLRERQPDLRITILLSDRHDRSINERWMKTCLANGYFWVSPHRTKDMIIQQLQDFINGSAAPARADSSKLLVFMGSTPNIGATLIAFGTAVELARGSEHRVGYICLNLKSSKLHR